MQPVVWLIVLTVHPEACAKVVVSEILVFYYLVI